MAANITISLITNNPQVIEPTGGQFKSELISAAGSSTAAADTGTYTTSLATVLGVEGGAFKVSQSGQTVTLTALYALGTNTVQLRVFGK